MHRERLRIINIIMLTIAGIAKSFGITIFLMPLIYTIGVSLENPYSWAK